MKLLTKVKMMRIPGVTALLILVVADALGAQTTPAADSARPNDVTAVSIKSGRLALSSASNPGPVFLPDGAYSNGSGTVLVLLDGRIIRVEYGSGNVSQVASMRVQRDKVMLTPPVSALMSVSPFQLPSGTFTSQDGAHALTVMSGRPTAFVIQAGAPKP